MARDEIIVNVEPSYIKLRDKWTTLKGDIIAIHGMTDSMLFELNGEDIAAENDIMRNIVNKTKNIVEKYR